MLPLSGRDFRQADAMKDDPEPVETTFELNDTLYAKANIPATEEVYIWLGVRNPIPIFYGCQC